jgi:hypothetical protein
MEPNTTETRDYAALNALWATLAAGVVLATREEGERLDAADLAQLSLATFALSKVVARERIGTWVRDPFVEESPDHKPGRPRGRRMQRAVGELLTCTRCLGAWSSLGLTGLRLGSPRTGRTVVAVLAASGANDFLQAGFRAICARADQPGVRTTEDGSKSSRSPLYAG